MRFNVHAVTVIFSYQISEEIVNFCVHHADEKKPAVLHMQEKGRWKVYFPLTVNIVPLALEIST